MAKRYACPELAEWDSLTWFAIIERRGRRLSGWVTNAWPHERKRYAEDTKTRWVVGEYAESEAATMAVREALRFGGAFLKSKGIEEELMAKQPAEERRRLAMIRRDGLGGRPCRPCLP
jgi:hypothetical protein